MSRAERRHQRRRIQEKYRQLARRWAGGPSRWIITWRWSEDFTRCVTVYHPFWRDARVQFIERTARRLEAHHKCPCGLCKRPRYERERADVHDGW